MLSRFQLIPERYGRTDGRTDRRTDRQICCINIAHRHAALLTHDKNDSDSVLPAQNLVLCYPRITVDLY